MPSRDSALDVLNNRLAAARADPGLLLTEDALLEAAELAASTDTATDLPAALALGWFHWNRYLFLRDGDGYGDREAAIRYFLAVWQASPASVPAPIEQAIRDLRQDNSRLQADPSVASDQATRLIDVYLGNGEPSALIGALSLLLQAFAVTPKGHPDRAKYLSALGIACIKRFDRTGGPETASRSAWFMREALAAVPRDHPDRLVYLLHLGIILHGLSRRTGDLDALSESIRVQREALAATPSDDPLYAVIQQPLADALHTRSRLTGDKDALDESIRLMRDALAASPSHPFHTRHLHVLGNALQARFEWTGDEDDLNQSILLMEEAVAVVPGDDPDRAIYLGNLGYALRTRSAWTGDTDALSESIRVQREALEALPDGHPERAACLTNLGNALAALSGRTGNRGALREAIQVKTKAVAAVPSGHPGRALCLRNLGDTLLALFARTGDIDALGETFQVTRMGALGEAIRVAREAVAAAPPGHPERAACLKNLGSALGLLFERTRDPDTLSESILVMREAVAIVPGDHPARAAYLNILGAGLQALSARTGDAGVLTEAVARFRAAGDSRTAPVNDRIKGWRRVAIALAGKGGESAQDALAAAEAASELLPQVAPRSLAPADRVHQLDNIGSLAGAVAAAAIAAGCRGGRSNCWSRPAACWWPTRLTPVAAT